MDWLEITGTLVGVLYLWFEYKASIWLWVAGIVMPAISLLVYYRAGLYADFGINVYYLLAGVYGWLLWLRGVSGKKELPVIHTPVNLVPLLLVVVVVLLGGIAWVLISFTDSTVPWADSLTTALSIIAMWMLAHKQAEQWLVWIVVDAVSCGLYFYKGLPFYAVLYGLYTIIAFFGYFKWCRMIQKE
ncbi:nicotinamide riboside transporter PnuC [Odoribacter lunatus]|uniref:nicotinamide riboside transporter PnuC n=1 Tax=Odoribacter lunatus TaxID=2941335 RepID=UPI0020423FF0|nr:nicotinamide riboside transporter PnuC [Odoribacter lunatus]